MRVFKQKTILKSIMLFFFELILIRAFFILIFLNLFQIENLVLLIVCFMLLIWNTVVIINYFLFGTVITLNKDNKIELKTLIQTKSYKITTLENLSLNKYEYKFENNFIDLYFNFLIKEIRGVLYLNINNELIYKSNSCSIFLLKDLSNDVSIQVINYLRTNQKL